MCLFRGSTYLLSSLGCRSFSKQKIWKRSVPVCFIRRFLRASHNGPACNPDACDFANLQLPAPLSWLCSSFPTLQTIHHQVQPLLISTLSPVFTPGCNPKTSGTAKSTLPEFTPTFADPTGHLVTTSHTSVEINKVRNKNSHIMDYSMLLNKGIDNLRTERGQYSATDGSETTRRQRFTYTGLANSTPLVAIN
jgi:hypothetical protein